MARVIRLGGLAIYIQVFTFQPGTATCPDDRQTGEPVNHSHSHATERVATAYYSQYSLLRTGWTPRLRQKDMDRISFSPTIRCQLRHYSLLKMGHDQFPVSLIHLNRGWELLPVIRLLKFRMTK